MNTHTKSHSLPFFKVTTNLSVEAQDYLSQTTDDTSHYAILNQLIKDTAVFPTTTSKRGNIIQLKSGQVECSINSFCQAMSLGRKPMERIIRDFERLGIIRLHRSRLATIADMVCISSWQLNDDSLVYNDIHLDHSDHLSDEQTGQMDEVQEGLSVTNSEDSAEVESKSPADTLPSTSSKSSVSGRVLSSSAEEGVSASETQFPSADDNSMVDKKRESQRPSSFGNRGLFDTLFESENDLKSSEDEPKA